jgi:hypothetical protein
MKLIFFIIFVYLFSGCSVNNLVVKDKENKIYFKNNPIQIKEKDSSNWIENYNPKEYPIISKYKKGILLGSLYQDKKNIKGYIRIINTLENNNTKTEIGYWKIFSCENNSTNLNFLINIKKNFLINEKSILVKEQCLFIKK